MSANARTWWAVAGVAALATLWWLTGDSSSRTKQRTFRANVAQVDTGALRTFIIRPALRRAHPEMVFTREGSAWTLRSAGYSTPADVRTMNELLALLADLHTELVLGRFDAVKDRYALADSTADHLVMDTPAGPLDLAVGNASGSEEALTAVHVADDDDAYAVKGVLGLYTDKSYVDWVPKPMVNGDPRNWRRLTFVFPGSQGYIMERIGDRWAINGMPTDSVKVAKYLRNLSIYHGYALANPADTLNAVLVYNLIVEDTTRAEPMMLGIFESGDHLIARSTLARHIVMPFDPKVELRRIFRAPQAFFPDDPDIPVPVDTIRAVNK